jgi:hypothetical protein
MKNTVRYLMEPLLSQFFLIDGICSGFLSEETRKAAFQELAEVFCVPMDGETESYYTAANASHFKSITDYAAYERLCRMIEFAQKSGQEIELSSVDRVILAQKRDAMQILSRLFRQSKNLTVEVIEETLRDKAINGDVDAMVTLSYLEYHGICICQDQETARKRLALCAKWNNLFGNLMGLAYDTENRDGYYNTLYTILRSAGQREVFAYLREHKDFDGEAVKDPVARVIEKAFGMGVIQRNTYDRVFSKVAFSTLISTEDKEKLLLNKKEGAIASLPPIPFDVDRNRKLRFSKEKASVEPLSRQDELRRILCSISPAVADRNALYRTLLVVSEDDYISEIYAKALKNGFGSAQVLEIDAGMLTLQDFVGAKENFILRGLSETKDSHTVFLLKHCDELGERELEELIKLLDYEYRRKYKLLEPTVSLDLSDVLIVLLASECNRRVKQLSEECDVVMTRRLSEEEKQAVIDTMFRDRSRCFGMEQAQLEPACRQYLAPLRMGQILRLLDDALKQAAFEDQPLITAQTLRNISNQQCIHRNTREFGYLGGGNHEKY